MNLPQPIPCRCDKCIYRQGSECISVLGHECMYDFEKRSDASKKGHRTRRVKKMHCCYCCTNENCKHPEYGWMSRDHVCDEWQNTEQNDKI